MGNQAAGMEKQWMEQKLKRQKESKRLSEWESQGGEKIQLSSGCQGETVAVVFEERAHLT